MKLIVITASLSSSVSELHLVHISAIQCNNLKGCKTLRSRLSGEARSASADAPSNHWLCDAALLLGLSSTKKMFIITVATSSGQHYSDRKIGMLTKVKMLQVTSDVCVGLEPFQRSGLNEVVLVQATNFTQQKQHLCLGVVLRSLFSLRSSTGVVFFLLSAFCACCARFQQVAQKEREASAVSALKNDKNS